MAQKTILIIDDEQDFARLLKTNLERATPYAVTVTHSGEAGVQRIAATPPDMVLLDINMPGMDGFETLKRIKALQPELPVAMVTALWQAEEMRRCMDAGAYEYIVKPVDMDYLKQALLVKLFR